MRSNNNYYRTPVPTSSTNKKKKVMNTTSLATKNDDDDNDMSFVQSTANNHRLSLIPGGGIPISSNSNTNAVADEATSSCWSMDIMNVLPKDIMDTIYPTSSSRDTTSSSTTTITSSLYSTGCCYGRWNCIITKQMEIRVWYSTEITPTTTTTTTSNTRTALREQKYNTPYRILYPNQELDTCIAEESSSTTNKKKTGVVRPLIKIIATTTTSNINEGTTTMDAQSIYLYIVNPISGVLLLWKISRNDLVLPSSFQQQHQPLLYVCKTNIFGGTTQPSSTQSSSSSSSVFASSPSNRIVTTSQGRTEQTALLTCIDVAWIYAPSLLSSATKTNTTTTVTADPKTPSNTTKQAQQPTKGSPCIIVGSTNGTLYWITQSHVPMSFHIQTFHIMDAVRADGTSRSGNAAGGGFLTRFFGLTPSKRRYREDYDNSSFDNNDPIVTVQLLPEYQHNNSRNKDAISYTAVSTSTAGEIIQWNIIPTETSYQSYMEGIIIVPSSIVNEETYHRGLLTLLQNYYNRYDTTALPIHPLVITDPDDDTAARNVHITIHESIVKLIPSTNVITTTTNNNDSPNVVVVSLILSIETTRSRDDYYDDTATASLRFYLVQGRVNTTTSKPSDERFQIVHVEWLHRLPVIDSIQSFHVYGSVITDNQITYAAIQCTNDGSDNNNNNDDVDNHGSYPPRPMVVIALPFPSEHENDDEDEEEINRRSKKPQLPASTLEQYELPEQQSFLYKMIRPDIITYGIVAFDESGLGVRIRYSDVPKHNHRRTRTLSSTDVFRIATTPAKAATSTPGSVIRYREHYVVDVQKQRLIPILMNHLYACHREAYRTSTSLSSFERVPAVPGIILSAVGTVELEQAIVQYCYKTLNTTTGEFSSAVSYYSIPSHIGATASNLSNDPDDENYNNNNDTLMATSPIVDSTNVLLQDIVSRTNTNAMEWHVSFLRFVQQTGIYKTLSDVTKWKLLEVGQQITVYDALCADGLAIENSTENTWQLRQLSELRVDNIASWLSNIQHVVVLGRPGGMGGEDRQRTWIRWLCLAIEAAMSYREEYAIPYYDIQPNQLPILDTSHTSSIDDIPIWTSKSMLQTILLTQLQHWMNSKQQQQPITVTIEQMECIIQNALVSFCDTYVCCGGSGSAITTTNPIIQSARTQYATCQEVAVALTRCINTTEEGYGDQLAFALSQAHSYFDGLCQISIDHDRYSDSETYSLLPFFTESSPSSLLDQYDVGSGELFAKHVLLWHIKNQYFGKVLLYGQYCPLVLSELMETLDILKPYRWIFQVTCQRNYTAAAESLVAPFSSDTLSFNKSTTTIKTDLSIASLCNSVLEKQAVTTAANNTDITAIHQRRHFIDQKRELINAQEELTGIPVVTVDDLLSSKELLDRAIEQLRGFGPTNDTDGGVDHDNRIRVAFIALAICTTFDDIDQRHDAAVFVWYETIVADESFWLNEVGRHNTVTDDTINDPEWKSVCHRIVSTTVFGSLYQQWIRIQEGSNSSSDENRRLGEQVSYTAPVEQVIFTKLVRSHPVLLTTKLQRLLRMIVTTANAPPQSSNEDTEMIMIANDAYDEPMTASHNAMVVV